MIGRVVVGCTRVALAGAFGAFLVAVAVHTTAQTLFPGHPTR